MQRSSNVDAMSQIPVHDLYNWPSELLKMVQDSGEQGRLAQLANGCYGYGQTDVMT